ncbi:MAG: hypothetical protein V2A69_10205 [Pseudomonadota bacterium]
MTVLAATYKDENFQANIEYRTADHRTAEGQPFNSIFLIYLAWAEIFNG